MFGSSQGTLGMDGEFVVMLQWQKQLQSGQKEILIERDPRVFQVVKKMVQDQICPSVLQAKKYGGRRAKFIQE